MNRISILIFVALLAACTTQVNKSETGEPRNATENRARIHTELGVAYYGAGQMPVAVQELKEAISADSGYAPAHAQLGLVYMTLKEDALAQQSFERALKIDPTDSSANNNYGLFLCQRKREKEAMKYFATALKNPLYATPENAYTNSGVCSRLQGDDVKAEEWLRKALALQPNQSQALYQLADIAFKRNELTTARTLLNRHMQVSTPSADALWLGVRIEQRLDNRSALASYGAQLNNRYPGAPQTKAYNEGRFQ
ncbi:MAG: type IV pilus biogenesis/stability protein PilW [Betaproteobacteria bacterium]|nr:type IV pilus biogenesis/stability protein PilW [Betaproteobacteria bacterium]